MSEDHDDGRFDDRNYATDGKYKDRGFRSKKVEEDVVFEARVERETAKALLLDPTIITIAETERWFPKSQIKKQEETSDGAFEFTVSHWIAEKKGIA